MGARPRVEASCTLNDHWEPMRSYHVQHGGWWYRPLVERPGWSGDQLWSPTDPPLVWRLPGGSQDQCKRACHVSLRLGYHVGP